MVAVSTPCTVILNHSLFSSARHHPGVLLSRISSENTVFVSLRAFTGREQGKPKQYALVEQGL